MIHTEDRQSFSLVAPHEAAADVPGGLVSSRTSESDRSPCERERSGLEHA